MKSKGLSQATPTLAALCLLGAAPQAGAVRAQRQHVSPQAAHLNVVPVNGSQHAGNSSFVSVHEPAGNISFVSKVRREIEYELHLHDNSVVQKNKLLLATITALGWGFCGCDRCYLGQYVAGVIKGLTLGGMGFWHLADFVVIAFNICTAEPKLHIFFFNASFTPSTVQPALYAFVFILCFNLATQFWAGRKSPHHEAKALCRRNTLELGERFLGPPSRTEIEVLFRKFDVDGSGALDSQELEKALLYVGVKPHEIDAKKQLIDTNKDGKVDITEFAEAFANGNLQKQPMTQGGSTGEAPS
mmetsp:Transcript_28992/g.67460  ORF Transcript_28992/g.67460 Transcript_28992/m.67460 type:complete len:301 (+) Transcript_28992:38-940(+)|eukprot:CAMPEP_0171098692 /NCGR_PEP_ID=MMETSP0766_2-20121228/49131_1 /TAXON_ID=439317 /ORGANISM="Gambierdiscus australes, Strain CAWD 149" /LENGTH=300 /DNA_ID=CAMNT_0011558103 /DNA_START=33 /DNA_END=935 /DNA_ORIENTATION=-